MHVSVSYPNALSVHFFPANDHRGDVSVTCRGVNTGDVRMLVDSGGMKRDGG